VHSFQSGGKKESATSDRKKGKRFGWFSKSGDTRYRKVRRRKKFPKKIPADIHLALEEEKTKKGEGRKI